MKLIDSHCHPQDGQYDKDREEMIGRALDGGVRMICVGTDLDMSKKAIELAQKYDVPILPPQGGDSKSRILDDATAQSAGIIGRMWASVGLHPNDNLDEEFDEKAYEELLGQNKVVAMGEIGLDYYRTEKPEDQKRQKDRFIQQLELAKKVGKPLILHCRDSKAGSTGRAYPDMIDILGNGYADLGGVVHSYTGSLDEAKRFLDLGFYLGFNGIITFPPSRPSSAEAMEGKKATDGQAPGQYDELVKYAPLDRILLETDAPYLTPEPYRGKRNEPLYVIEVAKKAAELKKISFEEVAKQTLDNTIKLFGLNG